MDTNMVMLLVQALGERSQASVMASPMVVVVSMVVGAVGPLLAALATYYARKAMTNTEQAKVANQLMADDVQKVHQAVNSERTAMLAEVTKLRDEILRLTRERAVLEEKQSATAERNTRQDEREERRTVRDEARRDAPDLIARLEAMLAAYEKPLRVKK